MNYYIAVGALTW